MRDFCPKENPDCKYFNKPSGCFSDEDHIMPRRLATTAMLKVFVDLPANKQQICRAEHDEKAFDETEEVPPLYFVRNSIRRAFHRGEVFLSRAQQQRFKIN